jgi:hypothetical protein
VRAWETDMEEEYKGRWIVVGAYALGHGFGWAYQIDNGPEKTMLGNRPLPSEELAIKQGQTEARREVDHMAAH